MWEKECYYVYKLLGLLHGERKFYIGSRGCPRGLTPKTDPYMGSPSNTNYKPNKKYVLSIFETKEEALEMEIFLHDFYDVVQNPLYVNRSKLTTVGFSVLGMKRRDESNELLSKTKLMKECKYYHNPETLEGKFFGVDDVIPEGFILGKSKEFKENFSKSQLGTNNPKWKGMWITPYGVFLTLKEAGEYEHVGRDTIMDRTKTKFMKNLYFFIPKEEWDESLREKYTFPPRPEKKVKYHRYTIITPGGSFPSVPQAAKALGIAETTVYKKVTDRNDIPDWQRIDNFKLMEEYLHGELN